VDASGNVLVCRPKIACLKLTDTADVLAGKCNVGFEGTACRACKEGFYRNVGDCEQCPAQSTSWAALVLIMVLHLFKPFGFQGSPMEVATLVIRWFPLVSNLPSVCNQRAIN
jgi:hypothetical protein